MELFGPLWSWEGGTLLLFLWGRGFLVLLGVRVFGFGVFSLWIGLEHHQCLSSFDVPSHLANQGVRLLHIRLLHFVLGSFINQSLQFIDLLFVTFTNTLDIQISLLSQIPLGQKPGGKGIDLCNDVIVKFDILLFSLSEIVVDSLYVLSDVLVVFVVCSLLDECCDFELLLHFLVGNFGSVASFDVDINTATVVQSFV